MTTYTMNGHKHSTMEVQPRILMGMLGNQVAQVARTNWRLRAMPEKYRCLESGEPHVQLQQALNQIEALLKRNAQLVQTVFLLSEALADSHALLQADRSISQSDQDGLRLSDDFRSCMKQLRHEVNRHAQP